MDRMLRRWISTAFLLFALLCEEASIHGSTPTGREIADVVIQGNRIRTHQQILSQMNTRPGKRYSELTAQEDVSRLHSKGWFRPDGIRLIPEVQGDGRVVVYLNVQELTSTVQEIVYRGADHLSNEELDKMTGLKRGMPMSPTFNQAARQAILRHYQEKGRYWAGVTLVEGNKYEDSRVVFDIVEGPVVKVSSVNYKFLGSRSGDVSTGRLGTQVSTSRSWLGGLVGGDFNVVQLDMDVIKLTEYYHMLGYLKARVQRELVWSKDMRWVDIIFHIEEGPRYKVEGMSIQGAKHHTNDELEPLTDVRPGNFFSGKEVRDDKQRMSNYIGMHGRQAAITEKVTEVGDGVVRVDYQVVERDQVRVGEVKIYGNTVTKQNVILRQLGFYPGQILSYPQLLEAERNLSRLGIFEEDPASGVRPSVEIERPEVDEPIKNILVNVREKPTGSFMIGAGVNSDAGITGSVVVNERNFDILRLPRSFDDVLEGRAFRGAGQEFRLELVPGNIFQRYTVSWREPYLLDSLYSLGLSGYYFTRGYSEFNESRLGGRVTLGRRITNAWSANVTARAESVKVFDVESYAPPEISDYVGTSNLFGLRPALTYDTRDNFLRPTSGMIAEAAYEQAFGTYTFPILTGEVSKYITTWERVDGSGRHVLALRSQVSWAGDNAPVYERFYAGGFRSLRGFSFRGVGPNVAGFNVGGHFSLLNTVEYQVPIMANDNLYLVGFLDHGTVEQNVSIKDYRVTAGAGLRIAVPQLLGPVPLALDFGFPINKAPWDNKQIFSFWLGFFN